MADYLLNRSWAEVDLNCIAHNVKEIRKHTDKNTVIMGVVKADAYGHGVFEVSKILLKTGFPDWLCPCWMRLSS